MKKSGFSSLELIMVIAVSAIIMTSLLEIYNQVTLNMSRVERFVFEDTQVLALKNRFGKDLSGLSAIWFTQGEVETKQLADGEKMPAPEKRKRNNYFYGINKNKHLDMLTFVTTNALQSHAAIQERFVRIVYKVEEDQNHKGMFRLMRKEISMPTENIDEQTLSKGTFYELVSGIKSLEMTYHLIDKIELQKQYQAKVKLKNQSGGQASQEKQEEKPVIRSVKQWGLPDVKEDDKEDKNINERDEEEKQKLGGAAVPKFIEMKIVFGATNKQLEKEYKLEFCIPSTVDNVPKSMSSIKKQKAGTLPAPKGSDAQATDNDVVFINNGGLS